MTRALDTSDAVDSSFRLVFFRQSDACETDEVPAELLTESLHAMTRLVHLVAIRLEGGTAASSSRVSPKIRRRYPVNVEFSKSRSWELSLAGVHYQDQSKGVENVSVAKVVSSVSKILRSTTDGRIDFLDSFFLSQQLNRAARKAIGNLLPDPSSEFSFRIDSRDGKTIFDPTQFLRKDRGKNFSSVPGPISLKAVPAQIQLPPGSLQGLPRLEDRVIFGKFVEIHLERNYGKLRIFEDNRVCKFDFNSEIKKRIADNVLNSVQLACSVSLSKNGQVEKIVNVDDVKQVALDEIRVTDVSLGKTSIRACRPLIFYPFPVEEDNLVKVKDDFFGIIAIAHSASEVREQILEELDFLWQEYALAEDSELSEGAIRLKARLLEAFEEVEDAS